MQLLWPQADILTYFKEYESIDTDQLGRKVNVYKRYS